MSLILPPLSLYIHMPWCIKKCPYCDFNSHELKSTLTEEDYIKALIQDLQQHTPTIKGRTLHSIFIGGGTPSLFSANSIEKLLNAIHTLLTFPSGLEITLEANPGAVDQQQFLGFHQAGVNRLSIGVQSFQKNKLNALGRIHSGEEAQRAVEIARRAGIDNFNIDLMFGLPEQSIQDALYDLQMAASLSPTHISWYQLNIEPHTAFYHRPPVLPHDDTIWAMQTQGQALLAENHYKQYEISAYSKEHYQCRHNNNYWEFGDYIGIGAGAHSKITNPEKKTIMRCWKVKNPRDYLNPKKSFIAEEKIVPKNEIAFEFMLNALRLYKRIPIKLFNERTGLSIETILEKIKIAEENKLINFNKNTFCTTNRGKRFLNDLLEIFI